MSQTNSDSGNPVDDNRQPSFFLRSARKLRDSIYEKIAPNTMLNARLASRLRSEYEAERIGVIFDIGAHKGNWASSIQAMMPNSRLILFEANPQHADVLRSAGFEHYMGILTKPGVDHCDFYSPDNGAATTGGSYYKEVTSAFDSVEGVTLPATTLEGIVETRNLPQPDLIKIDTQGSELDVIAGGAKVFEKAKWVLMELPMIEYNAGAPNISAYLTRMNELGFLPVELSEVHKFDSVIIQLDFLFVNKSLVDRGVLKNLHQ